MAFKLSGTKITQTGTDTDLSGLQALTSVVDYTVKGTRTVYNMKATLEVYGTLNIEPREETLEFTAETTGFPKLNVMLGSHLTVGTATTSGDETVYSIGKWFLNTHKSSKGWNQAQEGCRFSYGSNTVLNGGTMESSAPITVDSYVECGEQHIILQESLNQTARFMNLRGTMNNMTIYNNGVNLIGTGALGTNLKLIKASTIGIHGGSTDLFPVSSGGLIIDSYDYVISGSLIPWGDAYWTAKNCPRGSKMPTAWGSDGTDYQCLIKSTQDIEFTVTDLYGGLIDGAKVYSADYVNGETEIAQTFDLSVQNVYEVSSGADGVALIEGIVQRNYWRKKINNVYTSDNWNYRNKYNNDSDLFDFGICSYLYAINNKVDMLVRSSGIQYEDIVMLPDTKISESDKTIVDAYTELETSAKLYDYAKSYLYEHFKGETETIVTKDGVLINLGSYDLILDSTASEVFSFNGSTITIKASSFTGDMITTGVITVVNGELFNGTRTDTNGTIAPPTTITLTGLQENSEVRAYLGADSSTAIEIDGIENSSTSFTFTQDYAGQEGYIVIASIGYQNTILNLTYLSENQSIPVNQIIDRNYRNN